MRSTVTRFAFASVKTRSFLGFIACAVCLIASDQSALAQWKLATGFSNVNASQPNEVDQLSGFTPWGNDLLADAKCAIDLQIGPGPTPDSLFISTDNGKTWASYCANGGEPFVAMGSGSLPVLIGGAEPTFGDNQLSDEILSYSIDGGQTWLSDTAGIGGGLPNSIATIGNTIFASNAFGVYQQSSAGATWTVDTSGMNLGGNISSIGILAASGNNLFLSTQFNGILVSTNQGASWSSANSGLPTYTSSGNSYYFQSDIFAVSGSSIYATFAHDTDVFGGGDNFDTSDFYRTTNAGQSWTKMNSSIQNWGEVYRFTAYNDDLFAVSDSGFYYSTNNGSTWAQGDEGLQLVPGDYPNSVQVFGGNVVIGTNSSGAWYRSLSTFGISSVSATPSHADGLNLTLSQNPASSSEVKVTYTLNDAGDAQILVMDELGRSVRMLQNGPSAPGQNTVTLDPRTLDPGTYFVRLTADGTAAMQKLVIAR
jgi:photosystem II stability/assembly factor-like uncharacterized protein